MSVNLNKSFQLIFLLSFLQNVSTDELKLADEFKEGDIVSAETFNQIFDVLEKINGEVIDSDLLGTWECSSLAANEFFLRHGWEKKGFMFELKSSQINFTQTTGGTTLEDSLNTPYQFTTSSPSPIWLTEYSSSGSYSLYKGSIFFKYGQGDAGQGFINSWDIDLISESRFSLSSGSSDPNPEFVVCDSKEAVPAPPTNPVLSYENKLLTISWNDASVDETGFRIYRKSTEDYSLVASLDANETSYIDSDLVSGIQYYYYIVAFNDFGDSLKSKIVSFTLDDISPTVLLTKPENGGQVDSHGRITITFSETIEIKCPSDIPPVSCSDPSNPSAYAIEVKGNSENLFYTGRVGQNGQIFDFLPKNLFADYLYTDSPNTSYSVTIKKDYIVDKNGNTMEQDYEFNYVE